MQKPQAQVSQKCGLLPVKGATGILPQCNSDGHTRGCAHVMHTQLQAPRAPHTCRPTKWGAHTHFHLPGSATTHVSCFLSRSSFPIRPLPAIDVIHTPVFHPTKSPASGMVSQAISPHFHSDVTRPRPTVNQPIRKLHKI